MLAHLTFTDLLVVLVLLVSTGYAAVRGFIWEALTVFAWIAALLGCVYCGPVVVPWIRAMIPAPWIAEAMSSSMGWLTSTTTLLS